jgi:hypothetical protein
MPSIFKGFILFLNGIEYPWRFDIHPFNDKPTPLVGQNGLKTKRVPMFFALLTKKGQCLTMQKMYQR